ncbi:hypothetical protein Skr01_58350 [Sphaerisporangium krabiense]|uniref:Thioredoxin-related protein n=1 Tax=Sphaerisporangium krabiense TaxID=763782 RepID=A0A7W8Z8E7_9ACTN|nr:redoxin domain-containing protein [Sphaerisporangium krabiense]MBB5629399.1 thioredoxin-related protein [Sphaerisporangium krabiense]GII65750.1 hypothetical protein Skr01_58350 [Sphaerisporangium krabiense]
MLSATVVVFIGLLSVFNLFLTYGIIRRLREQPVAMARPQARPRIDIVGVDSSPDDFAVTFTDGHSLSSALLPKWTIVAFFSDHCPACREKLPTFVRRARELQHVDQEIISVVVGDQRSTADMTRELERVSRVTVEPENGPLARAFKVHSFPALCLLNESGTVTATGWDLDSLLTPANQI